MPSQHQQPHPHSPATGEIPPPPVLNIQEQTDGDIAARDIAALDRQIAFHAREAEEAEQAAKTARTEADKARKIADELTRQKEELLNITAAGLLAEVVALTGANLEDLARLVTDKDDAGEVSLAAKILSASGHVDTSAPHTPRSDSDTKSAPEPGVVKSHPKSSDTPLKPDLVINPDGSSKVVVTVDNGSGEPKDLKTPAAASSDKPIVITSADIPLPDTTPIVIPPQPVVSPNPDRIPIPPQPVVRPIMPPPAPRKTSGELPPLDVDPTVSTAVPATETSAVASPWPAPVEEATKRAIVETTKHTLNTAHKKLTEDLERYVRLSVINRKTSYTPFRRSGKKLEGADSEINSAIGSMLTAAAEHHLARLDAGQFSTLEYQELIRLTQPEVDEFAKGIFNDRITNYTRQLTTQLIAKRADEETAQIPQREGESKPEFKLRKDEHTAKLFNLGLIEDEKIQLSKLVKAERLKGYTDEEKSKIEQKRRELIAEGFSDERINGLIRGYLTNIETGINLQIAEGIYKGESKGKQGKTKLAFRTSLAKSVAEVEDGKLRKYGRRVKQAGVMTLAALAANFTGKLFGDTDGDRVLRFLTTVTASGSVAGYTSRGMARQDIGVREVFHPSGSIKPEDAIARDDEGNVLSGKVDYDHARTLAEERKLRSIVAAQTRIVEQKEDLDFSKRGDDGKRKRVVVKSDFVNETYTSQTRGIRKGNRRRVHTAVAIGMAVGAMGEVASSHGSGHTITPNGPAPVPDPTIATLP